MSLIKWIHNEELDSRSGVVTKGEKSPDKWDRFFLGYLTSEDKWVLSVRVTPTQYLTIFTIHQEMQTDKVCIKKCKVEAEKYYKKTSAEKNGKSHPKKSKKEK